LKYHHRDVFSRWVDLAYDKSIDKEKNIICDLRKIARTECNKEALKDFIKKNLNIDFIQSIFSPYSALVKRRIDYYTSVSTFVVLTTLLKKIAIYSY